MEILWGGGAPDPVQWEQTISANGSNAQQPFDFVVFGGLFAGLRADHFRVHVIVLSRQVASNLLRVLGVLGVLRWERWDQGFDLVHVTMGGHVKRTCSWKEERLPQNTTPVVRLGIVTLCTTITRTSSLP